MTLFVREHNHRRRVPFVASPPDSGAEAERLRRAFVEVAKHAEAGDGSGVRWGHLGRGGVAGDSQARAHAGCSGQEPGGAVKAFLSFMSRLWRHVVTDCPASLDVCANRAGNHVAPKASGRHASAGGRARESDAAVARPRGRGLGGRRIRPRRQARLRLAGVLALDLPSHPRRRAGCGAHADSIRRRGAASTTTNEKRKESAMNISIKTDNLRGEIAPLYCRYQGQTDCQGAYVQMNEDGIVSADYNAEIGWAVTFDVFHNRTLSWGVASRVRGDALADLLESDEMRALFERVHTGHDVEWDGNNNVGHLDDDARAASDEIEAELTTLGEDEASMGAVSGCRPMVGALGL